MGKFNNTTTMIIGVTGILGFLALTALVALMFGVDLGGNVL